MTQVWDPLVRWSDGPLCPRKDYSSRTGYQHLSGYTVEHGYGPNGGDIKPLTYGRGAGCIWCGQPGYPPILIREEQW